MKEYQKQIFVKPSIVNKLLSTIKHIYGDNFSDKTVGVVTPWRAQIALIKKNIIDKNIRENVTIDTVERFQGSEEK